MPVLERRRLSSSLLPRLVVTVSLTAAAVPVQAQFPVTDDTPPAGWTGPIFVPSFAFPASAPATTGLPWLAHDFRTAANGYMASVLGYVLEGQNTTTWRVQDNTVRKWFHAPWMHAGNGGREFVMGLTRERNSRALELAPTQTTCRQNWAVSFYNDIGGVTFGEVWGDGTGIPKASKAQFRPGAVAAKLLFTEATETEVPLLAGAPTVTANVHAGPGVDGNGCIQNSTPRAPKTMRLLQLDIAVSDSRADTTTGWVFGTFVYDGRRPGTDPWKKLVPVGLMWGNDPALTDAAAAGGTKPAESVIIDKVGFTRDFGRGGRMNGPVDNPASACLSCHMTSQVPASLNAAMAPPASLSNWSDIKCWFRNLQPSQPFGRAPPGGTCGSLVPDSRSTDYSLQLAMGIRTWLIAHPGAVAAVAPSVSAAVVGRTRSRDELRRLVDRPYNFGRVKSYPISRE